jgi:hypothetical protein
MAIDSLRLLIDSAALVWRRLQRYGSIEGLLDSACFELWLSAASGSQLDAAEEQEVRRDYRRMIELMSDITALLHSRSEACRIVRRHADNGS